MEHKRQKFGACLMILMISAFADAEVMDKMRSIESLYGFGTVGFLISFVAALRFRTRVATLLSLFVWFLLTVTETGGIALDNDISSAVKREDISYYRQSWVAFSLPPMGWLLGVILKKHRQKRASN